MRNDYLEINIDMVDELLNMAIQGKEIYGMRKHGLTILTKSDIKHYSNYFVQSTDIYDESNIDMEIIIPKYYHRDNFETFNFYNRCVKYLKDKFKLDIKEFESYFQVSEDEVFILFCILHEIGHVISTMKDYKKYNAIKTYYESEILYSNLSKNTKDDKDTFYEYRTIPNEYKADREAVRLMKKYRENIRVIMKRGYITKFDLSELI